LTSLEDCYINVEYDQYRRVVYTVTGVPFKEMLHIEGNGISFIPEDWVQILTLLPDISRVNPLLLGPIN